MREFFNLILMIALCGYASQRMSGIPLFVACIWIISLINYASNTVTKMNNEKDVYIK